MKKIKVNISEEKNTNSQELDRLMKDARQFELSLADEEALVFKIRNGNELAIEDLVKASSSLIYQFIGEHPSNTHSIMQQFTFVQDKLRKLALNELNSTKRESYFRFQAFHIHQALLELEG